MAFNYDKYLRVNKMPTLWCWGCGDGVILKATIRAIEKMGWDMKDVCVVSGIGCSGRFSSYIDCNTVHTTHGRTVAYATGIKLAKPHAHVIVVAGDGDGLAIGGNHTIHGLTNSQTSPTTPRGMWTVSQKNGNIDPTFNASNLAIGAGASFVARESMIDPKKLEKILVKAFSHKGWIDSITLPLKKWEALEDPIEKENILPTGVLREVEQEEYCDMYAEIQKAAQGQRAKITQDDFEKKI